FAVGQAIPLALGSGSQQKCTHAGGQPYTNGGNIGTDVLDSVVDCHAGGDRAPGAVDVEKNVLVGVFCLQKQQLGNDQVGHIVVDGTAQEYNPVLEQPGKNVISPFSAFGLLDNHGNKRHKTHT